MSVRAAIYMRTASIAQGEGPEPAIDAQRKRLTEYCTKKRWELVATFKDQGRSGMTTTRPGLDKLMKAASEYRFDVLLIVEPSRLHRYPTTVDRLQRELQAQGVLLVEESRDRGVDLRRRCLDLMDECIRYDEAKRRWRARNAARRSAKRSTRGRDGV